MSKKTVYEIITEQLLNLIQDGVLPWQIPWTNYPRNLRSKKRYRGVNYFMLNATAVRSGYKSNLWLTYKQATERGGHVRKGECCTYVVFWKWSEDKDEDGNPIPDTRRAWCRYYRVFNIEQCDNLEIIDADTIDHEEIPTAQAIADNMPNPPTIVHAGGIASYSPLSDTVKMPAPEYFKTSEKYYSTLFHELTHSTGHESRLDRFLLLSSFSGTKNSLEELTAEMGAAFLCGIANIENRTIDTSASYIENWLSALNNNPKWVIKAAARAQKAADHIQGISYE